MTLLAKNEVDVRALLEGLLKQRATINNKVECEQLLAQAKGWLSEEEIAEAEAKFRQAMNLGKANGADLILPDGLGQFYCAVDWGR